MELRPTVRYVAKRLSLLPTSHSLFRRETPVVVGGGIWPFLVCNPNVSEVQTGVGVHTDPNDCRGSYSVLVSFGDFVGGNLATDIVTDVDGVRKNVVFKCGRGRVIFLHAQSVNHWVEAVTAGVRNSFVGVCQDKFMYQDLSVIHAAKGGGKL